MDARSCEAPLSYYTEIDYCYSTRRNCPKPYSPIVQLLEASDTKPGFRATIFVQSNRILNEEYPFTAEPNTVYLSTSEVNQMFENFSNCFENSVVVTIPVYIQILLFFKNFWASELEPFMSAQVKQMRTNSGLVKMARSLYFQVKKMFYFLLIT